jgi:CRISPR/Cas system-associated endonuclease/helicase Cas3
MSKKRSVLVIDNDDEAYNFDYNDTTNDVILDQDFSDKDTIYLIHNECLSPDDPNLSEFLQFCLAKGLFDNTFYDTHNEFSVVATKLPRTFDRISNNKDNIKKKAFVTKFKNDFGYSGNMNIIYNYLDTNKKGFITLDDFINFFLPYIQYVTV